MRWMTSTLVTASAAFVSIICLNGGRFQWPGRNFNERPKLDGEKQIAAMIARAEKERIPLQCCTYVKLQSMRSYGWAHSDLIEAYRPEATNCVEFLHYR